MTLPTGITKRVEQLIPPSELVYLLPDVTVLGDVNCQLATANLTMANGSWAVLTNIPPSLQTFALSGKRFGGIESHFKDYKSGTFDVVNSHLRDAQDLTCLFMLLASASLLAIILGLMLVRLGQSASID